MPRRKSGPTIRDVAKRAGVSVKTVSRLLGGGGGVADATRARIEAVMRDLEYTPSAAARSLRGQHTRVLGLLSEGLTTTPDSFDLVRGIQDVAQERGVLVLIGETNGRGSLLEELIDTFRGQRVDAMIRASMYHHEVAPGPVVTTSPFVLLNCYEPTSRYPTVLPDEVGGGRAAAAAMVALGHTRIGVLTLPDALVATQLRVHGYRDALSEAALPFDPELVVCAVDEHHEDEFVAVGPALQRLLALPSPPTALLCGNDKMALRVATWLLTHGYSIPGDLSVVGYDNYRLICDNLEPALSSVALPYYEMGRAAAQMALDGAETRQMLVESAFVARASTRARTS